MKLSDKNFALLQRLEEELWIKETRFNRKYMDTIFADDFSEIGRSGKIYSREQVLSINAASIDALIPLDDLKMRMLSDDTVQLTYNSHVTYGGKVEKARRSSIWTRAGKGWVLRFHQGTPFVD